MYAIAKQAENSIVFPKVTLSLLKKSQVDEGDVVTFDQVLTVVNDADVKVGTPVVEGAKITAKVEKQDKAKKILVFKYKAKANYRRRQGHRQPFTKLTIEKIEA